MNVLKPLIHAISTDDLSDLTLTVITALLLRNVGAAYITKSKTKWRLHAVFKRFETRIPKAQLLLKCKKFISVRMLNQRVILVPYSH